MDAQMKRVLATLVQELDNEKISYAVGSSVLLHLRGLEPDPGDIDLFFPAVEQRRVESFFASRGKLVAPRPREPYRTGFFYTVCLEGVQVDLIGHFGVCREGRVYRLAWETPKRIDWEGLSVPVLSLESWLVFYHLMDRPARARRVRRYLAEQGVGRRDLLERALDGPLPPDCRRDIERLLKV